MRKRRSLFCRPPWVLALCMTLAPLAHAGEIYGRVGRDGKVLAGATVTIQCESYSDSRVTDQTGAYRSSGPHGEQKCEIRVSGADNPVPVITSQGRTRVNLEVKGASLFRR